VREIADDELTLAEIPPAEANWEVIGEFSLSYNGYVTAGSFTVRKLGTGRTRIGKSLSDTFR